MSYSKAHRQYVGRGSFGLISNKSRYNITKPLLSYLSWQLIKTPSQMHDQDSMNVRWIKMVPLHIGDRSLCHQKHLIMSGGRPGRYYKTIWSFSLTQDSRLSSFFVYLVLPHSQPLNCSVLKSSFPEKMLNHFSVHLFVHSFNEYLWHTYYVLGTVLSKMIEWEPNRHRSCSHGFYSLMGKTDIKN